MDKEKAKVKEQPKYKSMRTSRKAQALELIKKIRTKVMTLRHGYLADEEFDELEELIKKL